jgi:hypothetical protein
MEPSKVDDVPSENGAFYRRMLLPEERRLQRYPEKSRPGYRWFASENVVAIEHFRNPHMPGQKAGRFGWIK